MKKIKMGVTFTKDSIFMILFCVTLSMFFTQSSFSQYGNTITGFVFDSQRNPVSQVPVELLNEINQTLQRTRTNNSGRFFFSGLSSGRFSVKVLPYGTDFEEQTQDVEVISIVRSGIPTSDNVQKDFYLRSRRRVGSTSSVTETVFAQDIPKEAQKFYNKAQADFDDKKDDSGIRNLLNAIKIFPDYFVALERLGKEYIKQQKYEEARASFIKTVSVNQRSFVGWYGLSYASYALKQFDVAIEAGQNAFNLYPSSVEASLILGISLRQARRYSESEKALLIAKKLAKGNYPDVHWNLALLYDHNLKRYNDAADELELYLKSQPNDDKANNIKRLIAQLRAKAPEKK